MFMENAREELTKQINPLYSRSEEKISPLYALLLRASSEKRRELAKK